MFFVVFFLLLWYVCFFLFLFICFFFSSTKGWGRTEEGRPSDFLKQAKMPITPHEECKKKYRRGYDRQVHLCAGEGREGATGGCQGDSGGPFVCEIRGTWYLHGAVSFGERWCSTVYYTIFTRITTYVPWILNKIGACKLQKGNR